MVLIFDGTSEHVAHALRQIDIFGEKKIRFVTWEPISELPSNISTL